MAKKEKKKNNRYKLIQKTRHTKLKTTQQKPHQKLVMISGSQAGK